MIIHCACKRYICSHLRTSIWHFTIVKPCICKFSEWCTIDCISKANILGENKFPGKRKILRKIFVYLHKTRKIFLIVLYEFCNYEFYNYKFFSSDFRFYRKRERIRNVSRKISCRKDNRSTIHFFKSIRLINILSATRTNIYTYDFIIMIVIECFLLYAIAKESMFINFNL